MAVSVDSTLKGWQVPGRPWAAWVAWCLRALGLPRASVALRVCGGVEMRALNRRYRGIDRATDVLSFPAQPGAPKAAAAGHLGDLALDWNYLRRRYPRFEATLGREAALVLLHGCLHLSGRHHDSPAAEARLWAVQRRLMKKAGPRRADLPLPRRLKRPRSV